VRCIGNPPIPTSRNSRSRGCISLEGRPNLLGRLNGTILIYGATGYTGKLIAKAAADAGARPILAGRNLAKVDAVASLDSLPGPGKIGGEFHVSFTAVGQLTALADKIAGRW
jgi:NAD(P)-dependent dehydrogenase (short-subunit alcohol dehydrogenase family)